MSWNHLRDERVKARKKYRCFLCGEPIDVGDIHIVRTGTDDGIFTFRMHVECEEVTQEWGVEEWESHETGSDFDRPIKEAVNG